MSHYSTIKTKFKFKVHLINALKDIYGDLVKDGHGSKSKIYGYYGAEFDVDIAVRTRGKVLSADIGFNKGSDGFYEAVIDDMHTGELRKIVGKYAESVIKTRLPRKYQIIENNGEEITIKQLY